MWQQVAAVKHPHTPATEKSSVIVSWMGITFQRFKMATVCCYVRLFRSYLDLLLSITHMQGQVTCTCPVQEVPEGWAVVQMGVVAFASLSQAVSWFPHPHTIKSDLQFIARPARPAEERPHSVKHYFPCILGVSVKLHGDKQFLQAQRLRC